MRLVKPQSWVTETGWLRLGTDSAEVVSPVQRMTPCPLETAAALPN
jgi:hypothetical protein